MERKTKLSAAEGGHDVVITREFDLPLDLLFRAHAAPEIIEEWMGTKVLEFEARKHGGWQYQTADAEGRVVFGAHGVFHEFLTNEKITRTFEMENTPFPPQLEFLEFESLGEDKSLLRMQIVYRSAADREAMLRLPFAQGLNMAHNRLQEVADKLKEKAGA